ncbi:MAG: T9SS type A sorting domain-containing protein, partial [Saprospiraceae bacterium]
SGATTTSADISSMPTKSITAIVTSAGLSTDGVSMRSSRKKATAYYKDGVRIGDVVEEISGEHTATTYEELPESGQLTAGEWNDLHNWKDWMELLKNEDYSIMTNRFEIYPTQRYSVLAINNDNNVLVNMPVELIDKNGTTIWKSYTDNAGKAELWLNAMVKGQTADKIKIYDGKKWKTINRIKPINEGTNTIILDNDCYSPNMVDIVFAVDATSSMSDEIFYLKSELLDVIDRIKDTNEDIDFQVGSIFYRDTKDDYLTKVSKLSNEIAKTIEFVGEQNAGGGGDFPEAVDEALKETLKINWRKDALKIAFLILDAPPHEDEKTMALIRSQIQEAAARGIKLIPVTASGINRETEFLMKFMAMLTNGTYVFITDHSGIGSGHLAPVVEDYEVEKLNDCLVRLINQYSKSYSCDVDQSVSEVSVDVFPNPCTQYINVKTDNTPSKIKILSANGMTVKSISPNENNTRIELNDLINGIYTVIVYIDNQMVSKQVILLK